MNTPTTSTQASTIEMPAGVEPLDAYRALQLMPSAPHDLIEQAYWVLVGRTRARGSNSSSLGRLNDAYATLINPERRAAYDLEHGLTKLRARPKLEMPKRPMFTRKPRFTTRLTHYQLLDIDFEALPEVVDTAYVFHKAQLRRSDPRTIYLRVLFEEAHATLSSPQMRSAYDDKVAPRKRPVTEAPRATAAAPAPPAPAPLFPEVTVDPPAPEQLAAQPIAPAATEATAAPSTQHGGVRGWLRGRLSTGEGRGDGKSQRELRAEAQQDVITAEQKRLSDLGLLAERPAQEAPRPILGRARFRFTDGPQAGETIGLAENSLILGASDAADVVLENPDGMIGAGHVRVWRRDHEYILHQLDSFSTTYVNGERLDLRLAILEPGDEIRIGPHTMIFDEVPVEQMETAETAQT